VYHNIGPLLFLIFIYVNDLNVVSKLLKCADDTNIFRPIRGNDLEKLTQQINCELKRVTNWFFSKFIVPKWPYRPKLIIFGNEILANISTLITTK